MAYDPRDANWHNYQATISDSQVWIEDDGTVKFQDGGQWGYKPNQGGWTAGGSTLPLSHFVAQPNNGPPPLQVWLTDMSIGGTSVHWNLGDGSTSPDRSLRYTFTQDGKFSVTQRVTSSLDESLSFYDINVWDVTPPAGSILINGGAAFTNSIAVTLSVSVSGADSGSMMRFANGDATGPRSEWSAWEPLAATKAWSLTRQDGEAQVWAQFKDDSSNYSSPTSDTITLDATPPAGSITINAGAQYANTTAVTLNLWADDGTGSGLKAMMVCNLVKNTGGKWIIPDDFLVIQLPYATSTAWNLSAGDGPKRVAVFFLDAAGNVSPMYFADIILDATRPIAPSIYFNCSSRYTRTPDVTLLVSAGSQDTTGLQMSVGEWVPFPLPGRVIYGNWQPYASTVPVHLTEQYTRKYVRFMDAAGNISSSVNTYVILDTSPPLDGTLTASGGEKQVTLNWSGFSDAVSSISTYKLYCSTRGLPDVTKDPLLYQTGDTSFTHQNLQKGRRYYYRVVAIDQVGNVSTGATAQATTKGRASPGLLLLLGN